MRAAPAVAPPQRRGRAAQPHAAPVAQAALEGEVDPVEVNVAVRVIERLGSGVGVGVRGKGRVRVRVGVRVRTSVIIVRVRLGYG